MTEVKFEKLTRWILIAATLCVTACVACELKETLFQQIVEIELAQIKLRAVERYSRNREMANEYWHPSEGRFGTNWNSIAGEQTVLLRSNSSDRLLSDPVPITNLPFSSIEGRRAETVDETNAEPIVRVDDFM